MALSELETALLKEAIRYELGEQVAEVFDPFKLEIIDQWRTPMGGMVCFKLDPSLRVFPEGDNNTHGGDTYVDINNGEDIIVSVIFVVDGMIDALKTAATSGFWPKIREFTVISEPANTYSYHDEETKE
ncbi:MAG: hypothetical protein R3E66_22600 [bacterium]